MIPRVRLTPAVRRVAAVVSAGSLLSQLDATMVAVGLDSIARGLGAPLSTIQWVSSGYLVAFACSIPLAGWATERFGPRRVWTTMLAGVIAMSALSGAAVSDEMLIACRAMQGFLAGMVMPVGMIALARVAGPAGWGRVMSAIALPLFLAPLFGPLLGGVVTEALGWRWLFAVNVPVGLFALVMGARLLPAEPVEGVGGGRLDVRGLGLLAPGIALMLFGFSRASSGAAEFGRDVLLPAAAGALLVLAFVRRALRHDAPVLDVRLFLRGGFAAAAATVFLTGAALFGGLVLLPLYFQTARGLSAAEAGVLIIPQGVGAVLALRLAGRLAEGVLGGTVVLCGVCLLLAGTVPFAFATADTPYWLLCLALVVRGCGQGLSMIPAMASAYELLERVQIPRGTPMLSVMNRLGGAAGAAVLAVVLERGLHGAGAGAPGQGVDAAFATSFWWASALVLVAFVPAYLLWRAQRATARSFTMM